YWLDFVASVRACVVRAVGQVDFRGASTRLPSRLAFRSSPHAAAGQSQRPRRTARRQTRQKDQRAPAPVQPSNDTVIATTEMRTHARPRPIFGPLDQASAHGIKRDIAVGGDEVLLIHRHRAEPRLPEMPSPAVAPV